MGHCGDVARDGRIGRLWWWSDTARFRPEPSVSSEAVQEGLECGKLVGGNLGVLHMACLVVTVIEAVARDEPSGAHLDRVGIPWNSVLYAFVGKVCSPGFSGTHLELFRLMFICDPG